MRPLYPRMDNPFIHSLGTHLQSPFHSMGPEPCARERDAGVTTSPCRPSQVLSESELCGGGGGLLGLY